MSNDHFTAHALGCAACTAARVPGTIAFEQSRMCDEGMRLAIADAEQMSIEAEAYRDAFFGENADYGD
jgi:hypothetical protein